MKITKTASLHGLLLAASLCLTACADGGGITTRSRIVSSGLPSHANAAAARSPIALVIRGNPFAEAGSETGIADALGNHPIVPHLTFRPAVQSGNGYSVVLAFGTPAAGNQNQCREPAGATAGGGTQTTIVAAFCIGPILLSEAVANGPRTDSPRDRRFIRLMTDLSDALFPITDPMFNDIQFTD